MNIFKISKIFSVILLLFLSQSVFAGDLSYIPTHKTLDKGETIISDSFLAKVSGGFMKPRIVSIYSRNNGKLNLIGVSTFPKYASRQNAYAVSPDGKTIIYIHMKRYGNKKVNKSDGLYRYTAGQGDVVIHEGVDSGVYIKDEVPDNAIVFRRPSKAGDTGRVERSVIIRDTDGVEKEWNPRKNK